MKSFLFFLLVALCINMNAQYVIDTTFSCNHYNFYFEKDISKIPLKVRRLEILCFNQTEDTCSLKNDKMLFESLKNLNEIAISAFSFDKIPFNICSCPNIVELFLNNNGLIGFPNDIYCLKDLELLHISGSKIDSVFSLSEFPALKELSLINNNLQYIPDDLGDLKIVFLDLSFNPLINNSHTFETISQITSVRTLILDGMQIISLPENILHLENLKTLSLNYNNTINQDSMFCLLSNMKSLDSLSLEFCNIKSISPKIALIQKIKGLSLKGNDIKDISELCNLTSLKKLNLSETKLKKLPPIIVQLKKLEELDISYTKITILPNEMCELKNLKKLIIRGTKIKQKNLDELLRAIPGIEIISQPEKSDNGMML